MGDVGGRCLANGVRSHPRTGSELLDYSQLPPLRTVVAEEPLGRAKRRREELAVGAQRRIASNPWPRINEAPLCLYLNEMGGPNNNRRHGVRLGSGAAPFGRAGCAPIACAICARRFAGLPVLRDTNGAPKGAIDGADRAADLGSALRSRRRVPAPAKRVHVWPAFAKWPGDFTLQPSPLRCRPFPRAQCGPFCTPSGRHLAWSAGDC
jgi:hypothetical protein